MSEKFEIIDGQKYRKKVRAIILNEKKEFLLIRPKNYESDNWSFVGEGTEDNESVQECLLREIKEEVGIQNFLSIKKSSLTNKYMYKPVHQSKYDGQIAYYFVVEVESGSVVTIQYEEIADYRWVKFDKIPSHVKIKQQLDFLYSVAYEFGCIVVLQK